MSANQSQAAVRSWPGFLLMGAVAMASRAGFILGWLMMRPAAWTYSAFRARKTFRGRAAVAIGGGLASSGFYVAAANKILPLVGLDQLAQTLALGWGTALLGVCFALLCIYGIIHLHLLAKHDRQQPDRVGEAAGVGAGLGMFL